MARRIRRCRSICSRKFHPLIYSAAHTRTLRSAAAPSGSRSGITVHRSSSFRIHGIGADVRSSTASRGRSSRIRETLFAQLQSHEIDVYDGITQPQVAQLRSGDGIRIVHRLVANLKHMTLNLCASEPARRSGPTRDCGSGRLGPHQLRRLSRHERTRTQRHPAQLVGRAERAVLSARPHRCGAIARGCRLASRGRRIPAQRRAAARDRNRERNRESAQRTSRSADSEPTALDRNRHAGSQLSGQPALCAQRPAL